MRLWATAIVVIIVLAALTLASSGDVAGGEGEPRIASILGIARVQGENAIVHVVVAVQPGKNASEVARQALREIGAKELSKNDLQAAQYTTSGLVWDVFSDADPDNNFVRQYYNPSNGPAGAYDALRRSQSTWTNVALSSYAVIDAGTTSRCPSLVQECPGPQYFDGFIDVGWLRLGPNTLGVTWYSTARDEADMALNTRFRWYTGTNALGTRQYDAETVYLHENGHVAGIGHSDVDGAVMEPYYEGVRRTLHGDDIAALVFLYP